MLWLLMAIVPVRSRDVRLPYLTVIAVASVVGVVWSIGSLIAVNSSTRRIQEAVVLAIVVLPGGLVALVRLLASRPKT
ncbi:hypothetical protein ACWD3Z_12080 [Streptomyces sp. NPDC002740]